MSKEINITRTELPTPGQWRMYRFFVTFSGNLITRGHTLDATQESFMVTAKIYEEAGYTVNHMY